MNHNLGKKYFLCFFYYSDLVTKRGYSNFSVFHHYSNSESILHTEIILLCL